MSTEKTMLPKRKGTPAQYGETAPAPLSASKTSSSGEKAETPGAFLAYIHCALCNYPFIPETGQPAREFFMTSCRHIVCNDPSHNHKKQRCTVCGQGGEENPVEATLMDDQMTEDLQSWFMDPNANIRFSHECHMRNKFHIKELRRHIGYLNDKLSQKIDFLNRLKPQLKQLKDLKSLQDTHNDLQVNYKKLEELQANTLRELTEAKRRLAEVGMDGVSEVPYRNQIYSSSINDMKTHRPPFDHIPRIEEEPAFRPSLPPLQEEEEEYERPNSVLGKRSRDGQEMTPQFPDGFRMDKPLIPLLSSNMNRNQAGSMGPPPFPHIPQNLQDSFVSRFRQDQQQDHGMVTPRPHSALPRTNLEQYRFEGNGTPQPFNRPVPRRPGSVLASQKYNEAYDNGAVAGPGPTSQTIQRLRSLQRDAPRRPLM